MNDQDLELLSAYIDGALPESERRALEARLAASSELRRELDELRAVAKAVKDLPKEPLPPGFLARFQARRARGDSPRQDYFILPPAMRPAAFALSTAIVALVVWDRVVAPPEPSLPSDAQSARVVTPANAPIAQVDLAKQITGASSGVSSEQAAADAAKAVAEAADKARAADQAERESERRAYGGLAAAKSAGSVAAARGRAPGAPIGVEEKLGIAAAGGAVASAPATMSEEERSARNEQMFDYLEKEKKRMGIARVLPKEESSGTRRASVAAMLRQGGFAEPESASPAEGMASAAPKMLKAAKKSQPVPEAAAPAALTALRPVPTSAPTGRLSPEAGLVFADARSLASSWVLLGFPGEPPRVDFDSNRVVLLKPSATKILSATPGPDAVTVVFRSLGPDEETDPARDRVALAPAGRLPVLFFDATR